LAITLPPHFHAIYGDNNAVVDIESLALIEGSLPPRARGLVIEWATIHQEDLREAFQKAADLEAPGKIEPLS
jgi:hypothetical protein